MYSRCLASNACCRFSQSRQCMWLSILSPVQEVPKNGASPGRTAGARGGFPVLCRAFDSSLWCLRRELHTLGEREMHLNSGAVACRLKNIFEIFFAPVRLRNCHVDSHEQISRRPLGRTIQRRILFRGTLLFRESLTGEPECSLRPLSVA